jgi:hypothetical protein
MNIEKILYNKSNKLRKNGTIDIVDAELDLLKCKIEFNCIEINTKGYEYIMLTKDNLYKMIQAINKMETND